MASVPIKKLYLFLFLFGVAACGPNNEKPELATIYYVPLGLQTFSPVTEENIESAHSRFGRLDVSDRSFKRLLEILESAESPGKLDGYLIRAKIILPDDNVLFVDNLGGVRMPGLPDRILSDWSYAALAKLLHETTSERQPDTVSLEEAKKIVAVAWNTADTLPYSKDVWNHIGRYDTPRNACTNWIEEMADLQRPEETARDLEQFKAMLQGRSYYEFAYLPPSSGEEAILFGHTSCVYVDASSGELLIPGPSK